MNTAMLTDALSRLSDRELDTLARFAQAADLPPTVAAHWYALAGWERARRAAITCAEPAIPATPSLAPGAIADGVAAADTVLAWFTQSGRTDTRLTGVFAALARQPQQDVRAAAEAAFSPQVQA